MLDGNVGLLYEFRHLEQYGNTVKYGAQQFLFKHVNDCDSYLKHRAVISCIGYAYYFVIQIGL